MAHKNAQAKRAAKAHGYRKGVICCEDRLQNRANESRRCRRCPKRGVAKTHPHI